MASGYAVLYYSTTVSSGGTTSAEIDLQGMVPVGITFPASMTSTSASFTVSDTTGGTFRALYRSDGTLYTITVTASAQVILPPYDFCGARFIKIVTGSSEGADRTILLAMRDVT